MRLSINAAKLVCVSDILHCHVLTMFKLCRNLAAKNHESQTALHLASYHGHVEVVQQLLKYGAKVVQTQTQNQIYKNTVMGTFSQCQHLLF